MLGGVGRYAANLTDALRRLGAEVIVACNEKGNGDYYGLFPTNTHNSERLLEIVNDAKPDVVHVQFEPGLYGLIMDPTNPKNSRTYIDPFYRNCKIPIVTTFHSSYTFRDWMSQALMVKSGRYGRLGIPARVAVRAWRNFINYKPFNQINREKLRLSQAGVCFSKSLSKSIGGGAYVIFHGSEPAIPTLSKERARQRFSLPLDRRIAVVIGFRTITKGWDILDKIEIPAGWIIVSNSAKGHYNKENLSIKLKRDTNFVDLQKGYLNDEELSTLLFASDIVLLPYKITSGSGVMFDALAHGLPFVASDLEFFREFAKMNLGIATKRNPKAFAKGIEELGNSYETYWRAVDTFKRRLRWNFVANQHIELYSSVVNSFNPALHIDSLKTHNRDDLAI